MKKIIGAFVVTLFLFTSLAVPAKSRKSLHGKVLEAIALFKEKDPDLLKFFNEAYGYVVFPRIGKGGLGIGGARGRGEVYQQGKMIGTARITQVTVGFQLGGQVYSEVIFFKTSEALRDFKHSKLKLSAQATAIAAASGASANAKYSHDIAIFTLARNGLMYEATVGGQKFKYFAD